jgi:hypothetical protein
MKVRSRNFSGRCARHKNYNPAVDGREGIQGDCPRCTLLADILDAALHLNALIRKFNPRLDDLQKPPVEEPEDDRQLSLPLPCESEMTAAAK